MTVRIYVDAENLQDGTYTWETGGGTADAITATYSPALTALVDGQMCFVRATAANTTTTPTFAPNGLTAHTITKTGGSALSPGDISGAGHELILRYNLTNTRWELLNPATIQPDGIESILHLGASVTGASDATATMRSAVTSAYATKTTTSTNWSDPVVRASISLPPGTLLFSTADPFGGDIPGAAASGLNFNGAGILSTALKFTPASTATMFNNGNWAYGRISNMSVYSDNASNVFAHHTVASGNGVGGWGYTNMQFVGSWDALFRLTGDNNNDNTFYNQMLFYGAFGSILNIPSGGCDQHVNHWFNECRAYLPNGCWLDITKGGSIHLTNWTADAPGSGTASTLFKLNQSTIDAYNGQFNFAADFGRPEISASSQKLVTCAWPTGNVTFRNMDMSGSKPLTLSATQEVATYTLTKGGATVGYYNSFLAGVHNLAAPTNPQYYPYSAIVRDCLYVHSDDIFENGAFKITPQSGETNTAALPVWQIENVRGVPGNFENVALRVASTAYSVGDLYRTDDGYVYYISTAGTSSSSATFRPGRSSLIADGTLGAFILDQYPQGIWAKDANVKADGAIPLGTIRECTAILTGINSALPMRIDSSTANGDAKIILPINAKVFSIGIRFPSGATSQNTTGTWKVRTDAFTPTVLATFAVTDPSSGAAVETPVAYDVGVAAAVGQDAFGDRSLVLEAQTDVTAEIDGGYVIVRYF